MSNLRTQIEQLFEEQIPTRGQIADKILQLFEQHDNPEIRKAILETFSQCGHNLLHRAALEFDDKRTPSPILVNYARLYRDLHQLYVAMFSEEKHDIVVQITEFRLQKEF